MKCFVCDDGTMVKQLAEVEGIVKRKKFKVEALALVCKQCGHVAMEGEDTAEFLRTLADAYRRKHKLLTSSEIRTIRGGLSQQRCATEVGVGVASLKRWELGLVQDRSSDKLLRAFARRNTPTWTYETSSGAGACLASNAGRWPLAHGPPQMMQALEASRHRQSCP